MPTDLEQLIEAANRALGVISTVQAKMVAPALIGKLPAAFYATDVRNALMLDDASTPLREALEALGRYKRQDYQGIAAAQAAEKEKAKS